MRPLQGKSPNLTSRVILPGPRAGKQDQRMCKQSVQLEAQRKDVERNIANIQGEQAQLKEKIEQYEKWVPPHRYEKRNGLLLPGNMTS